MSGPFPRDAPRYHAALANVLPVERGTKRPPAGIGWKRWQTERQTEGELERLIEAHPEADVAIIMGPGSGGLIDIETDGAAGERALRDLCLPLPLTAMFTSRQGIHRLYRSERPLATRKPLRPALDVLAAKSYAVVPTSTGRKWLTAERIEDVALLPEAWEELLLVDRDRGRLTGSAIREAERHGVDEGRRNLTLAALVGRWLTQGVPEAEIPAKAREWARRTRAGTHPFAPEEAEQVAASVLRTRRRTRSPEREAFLLARDRHVDGIARLVLIGLVAMHGELGLPQPSLIAPSRLLAEYAGVDRDSVGPALRRLEKARLIVTAPERDPFSGRTTTVVTFLQPLAELQTWRKSGT